MGIKICLLSLRAKGESTRSSMTEKFIALYQPYEAHRFAGLLLGPMADRPDPCFDAQTKYSPRSRSGNRRPIGRCPPYRNTAVSYRRVKAAHKASMWRAITAAATRVFRARKRGKRAAADRREWQRAIDADLDIVRASRPRQMTQRILRRRAG